MTAYAVELSKRALTENETMLANQYLQGAQAANIKVTRQNVRRVFPPGVADLVMRALRGV